jgi:hypothetical protein
MRAEIEEEISWRIRMNGWNEFLIALLDIVTFAAGNSPSATMALVGQGELGKLNTQYQSVREEQTI